MPSSSPLFSVEDNDELWALWRLVYDAKFQTELRDRDLFGSAAVEALARRIDDAVLLSYSLQGKPEYVERHLQWRRSLSQNPYVFRAVSARLREEAKSEWWLGQSHEAKIAYVRGRLVPFEASDEILERLVRESEA